MASRCTLQQSFTRALGAASTALTMYSAAALTAGAAAAFPPFAVADDEPLAESRLLLKASSAAEQLQFQCRDTTASLPDAGSGDDPSNSGAVVELLSATGATSTLALPAAGWTVTPKGFFFSDKNLGAGTAGLRKARLLRSRSLKLNGRKVGFSLQDPQGSVALRLTMGTTRLCAIFAGGSVTADGLGQFRAATPSATLADCSDETIGGASCSISGWPTCSGNCAGGGVCGPDVFGDHCLCVLPSSPCGDTSPVCNGTCADGKNCVSIPSASDFSPSCICLPDGATPCGSPGAPRCGGECEAGDICRPIVQFASSGGDLVCTCGAPGACGAAGISCNAGFACGLMPGVGPMCVPMTCAGTYPTCGGSCGDGGSCMPLDIDGLAQFCVCADPAAPSCDICGGITCASGDVCRLAPDGSSCGCGLP